MTSCRFVQLLSIWDKYKSKFLKSNFSTSNKFEYSSPTALLNYNNCTPLSTNKHEKNKIHKNGNHLNKKETSCNNNDTFPCNNEEFFEMIKKNIKKNKNEYRLLNIYCKELMYRINDSNISANIITKTFSFLSYTDYKNDHRISEILNRCILRLNEFDLIHLSSLVISLSKMNFRSVYFMEQVQKKFIREEEYYFQKHSPHYICLFINSWVKLNCRRKKNYVTNYRNDHHNNIIDHITDNINNKHDYQGDHINNNNGNNNNGNNNNGNNNNGNNNHCNNNHINNNHCNYLSHIDHRESTENVQIINFLLSKISHRKVEEYSLIGISLLLYNISILKLYKYYYLFSLFKNHIIKTKSHLNVIQIVNILTAYNNVCLLKGTFLIELLECINVQIDSCYFHHLVRLMDISFCFVGNHNKNMLDIYNKDNIDIYNKNMIDLNNKNMIDINNKNMIDINNKNMDINNKNMIDINNKNMIDIYNKDNIHIYNKNTIHIHNKNTIDIYNNTSVDEFTQICHFITNLFNQLVKNTKYCKKKDVILLCGTLSKYKKWIDKNFTNTSSPLSSINMNCLFYAIRNNVKNFISLYNHVELSILLYCYSLYEINDLFLFHKIKLRSLKIFITFNQITFSYLFKAFENMKINDLIFEKACLHKILQINKFSCPKSLLFTLSALSSLHKKKKKNPIIQDIWQVIFRNFQDIFINNFYEITNINKKDGNIIQNRNLSIPSYLLYIEEDNMDSYSMVTCPKNETFCSFQNKTEIKTEIKKKRSNLIKGDILCMLVHFFSKIKEFDLNYKLIIILINEYENYKNILSTHNCISLLNSMGTLCAHMKNEKSNIFWRNYYLFINQLTKKILVSVDLYEKKYYLINFLSACGKIFQSYISIIYKINEEQKKFCFYLNNILDILITPLNKYINEFSLGDIGILFETFNKENYLQEFIYTAPKEKDDHIKCSFVNKIINRLIDLLNHINEKDYKNVIIIMNNIIKMNNFDKTIYNLIIKNYILQSFYYESIPMLSQSIFYICINVLFRDIIINTQQIYLLKYLFKKLFEQFINQEIFLFSTHNECLLISDKNINNNEYNNMMIDTIFIKSLIYLCQSIFIILFHISNIKEISYEYKIKSKVIKEENNELLNSITFLRLYLTIFMLTEKCIQEGYHFKKIKNFTSFDNSIITHEIHNIVKHMPIKSYYTSLLFYKLLLIKT
ncbi:hypothetical protein C923_04648 [Plasmodium falciparum UGT5.1]|uniref:Uncharacterized protein n=1 Tax=Plasmodium falciparum UGT5.1 TaxID=1237627 RepID=W7JIM1_PLAFA|nr:hypothetical protein C923_04648 [Plasmodium falciparum UGT5.1]